MGIVSSTFASLAIRLAWNCQRFLDPRYRYVEASSTSSSITTTITTTTTPSTTKPTDADVVAAPTQISAMPESGLSVACGTTPSIPISDHQTISAISLAAENKNSSLHQENRHRRAAQHRYRKRPSSFDVSLIIRNRNKTGTAGNAAPSGLVTHSTPSTLKRQQAPSWDSTSSSGCSSDSSESDTEFMYGVRAAVAPSEERLEEKSRGNGADSGENQRVPEDDSVEDGNDVPEEFAMSAADEAAFRLTVGRGHFSRSKKDRFLNHLRLEKRLNGLNKEFFELACRAHTRSLRRRHSGDLRTIV